MFFLSPDSGNSFDSPQLLCLQVDCQKNRTVAAGSDPAKNAVFSSWYNYAVRTYPLFENERNLMDMRCAYIELV